MPKFFFHLPDDQLGRDDVGSELLDDTEARLEAIRLAGAVLRDNAGRVAPSSVWRVEVTDARGRPLFEVSMLMTDTSRREVANDQ